jgi:hypothetical protein
MTKAQRNFSSHHLDKGLSEFLAKFIVAQCLGQLQFSALSRQGPDPQLERTGVAIILSVRPRASSKF